MGMTRTTVHPDTVYIDPNRRALREDTVKALMESIKQIGLRTPISIRTGEIADPETGEIEPWDILITGHHRLEAAKRLGWTSIDAIVWGGDERDAELWELDENLMRAELSASERAQQTARRKAIYLELHPETAAHVAGAHASNTIQGNAADKLSVASFATETAKAIGKDERTVRRDAERGEKVIPEVIAMIAGSKLDTGTYLDRIKNLTPNEQVTAAKRDLIQSRKGKSRERKSSVLADENAQVDPSRADGILDQASQEAFAILRHTFKKAELQVKREFLLWAAMITEKESRAAEIYRASSGR